jgi:hypothetical protein
MEQSSWRFLYTKVTSRTPLTTLPLLRRPAVKIEAPSLPALNRSCMRGSSGESPARTPCRSDAQEVFKNPPGTADSCSHGQ